MSKVILNIFYSDGSNQWIGPFKLEDDAIKYFPSYWLAKR